VLHIQSWASLKSLQIAGNLKINIKL